MAQKYAKAQLLINGVVQAEATSVQITHKADNQQVNTLKKGYSGFTPGIKMCDFSMEVAFPAEGVEFDFTKTIDNHEELALEITAGSVSFIVKDAVLNSAAFSQGAGQTASWSISGFGGYSPLS